MAGFTEIECKNIGIDFTFMLRRLGGIENAFANPVAYELVELAIKFTDKKSTEKALNNIKKILFGAKLYISSPTRIYRGRVVRPGD